MYYKNLKIVKWTLIDKIYSTKNIIQKIVCQKVLCSIFWVFFIISIIFEKTPKMKVIKDIFSASSFTDHKDTKSPIPPKKTKTLPYVKNF